MLVGQIGSTIPPYSSKTILAMIKNYFKITLRQLMKNKTFTFINLFGLTLGFLCFILLALYIHDELSFDLFHQDSNRMYRVLQHEKQENGTTRTVAPVACLIGKEGVAQFPEVEDMCRLSALGRVTVGNDPANRDYEQLLYADPNFFSFFDFKLLEGKPDEALKNPDAVVLSEKFAKKYFGDEPAFGKRLWVSLTRNDQLIEFTVTGIMKDLPKNSHLQIDMLFSEATFPTIFPWYNQFVSTDWTSNFYLTYLKLKENADHSQVSSKFKTLVQSHYPPDKEFKSEFSLQPFNQIHLYSQDIQGTESNSQMKPFYLYMFAAVGLLLLLIACLNYINLSTAAAFKRTREIGTRKTLGAQRGQLVAQFLSDSLILCFLSLLLAIVIVQGILPAVNTFTEKELILSALPPEWMVMIGALVLLAGFLSAMYPAFVSVKISASEALKREIKIASRSLPVRKVLLVVQFTISIIMIASTLVIYQQLQFMREKDLGFDTKGLLVIDINSDRLRRNFENVKEEFAKLSEVLSISASTRVPGEWKSYPIAKVNAKGRDGAEMIYVGIDNDFLKTYDIQLLEGRNFNSGSSDSLKVILTELAVQQLGLENPVGQFIEIPSARWGGSVDQFKEVYRAEVIGIADNFHFESLRNNMMPVIFAAPNTSIQRIDYYTLEIKTSNWDETLSKLKAINTQIDPEDPLEYTFLDNRFEEFYRADTKRGQIFLTFSIVIVLIASMGLFALVSYSVETRTKEIGVRKVLGASVKSIIGLISKEFLVLVFFACIFATPVAWYFMKAWLQEFAYRIDLGAGIFFLASFIAVLIAFATTSFRAIRAARANPVDSLRSE
jgi:putative ABC transport system permease protein